MSLVVNHNMMAAHSSRILNSHYRKLSDSTRKLSSGLRVETAADDAAGLAIRELMRAEISTLNQGVRNANDAISLIQTADGAMQVIDEKLIRMKELAEQAATGTYDSTQRLIIESEYQQMASEITRIANATDFNNIKLLDGNLSSSRHDGTGLNSTGKLKVHFGTGNDSAEDYYYIQIDDCRAAALGLGSASTVEDAAANIGNRIRGAYEEKFRPMLEAGNITADDYAALMEEAGKLASNLQKVIHPTDDDIVDRLYGETFANSQENYKIPELVPADVETFNALTYDDRQKLGYAFARTYLRNIEADATVYNGVGDFEDLLDGPIGNNAAPLVEITEAMRQSVISGAAAWGLSRYNYDGMNIATQENAQIALDAIDQAIEIKDNIRANLGAMQNRLENTITNLEIQAENLQAAESQISDVDVATEMTNFTRNQILTQSAVAMLGQANSLPQMAMQLIGG